MYEANGNTISPGGISFAYTFQNLLVQGSGVTIQYLIGTLSRAGLPQVMDESQNGAAVRT